MTALIYNPRPLDDTCVFSPPNIIVNEPLHFTKNDHAPGGRVLNLNQVWLK